MSLICLNFHLHSIETSVLFQEKMDIRIQFRILIDINRYSIVNKKWDIIRYLTF